MKKNWQNILGILVILVGYTTSQEAAEKVWNGSDGNWGTVDSWVPTGIPGLGDDAKIHAGTVDFTYENNLTAQTLEISGTGQLVYLGGDTASFNPFKVDKVILHSGGKLNVQASIGGNDLDDAAHNLSGTWLLNNGHISATKELFFGEANVTMNGAESTFSASALRIGNYGTTGIFTQNAGTTTIGFTTIGEAGSGRYCLNGGVLSSDSNLVLGVDDGTVGVLEINGGSASIVGLTLGWDAFQGTGKVFLHGGELRVGGDMVMGGSSNRAENQFVQTGGTATISGQLKIASGKVEVSGGTFLLTTDNIDNVAGTWNISGGHVNASGRSLYFGEAQIMMTGGTITANQLRIGNAGTTGWMVQKGGHVNATTWLTIGEAGSGKYTLDGGTVTHSGGGAFVLGVNEGTRGELEMNGGAMTLLGNGGMILGYANNSVGVAVMNGGTLNVQNSIQIGRESTHSSSFTQNGGVVTAGGMTIKAGNQYTLAGGTLTTPTIVSHGMFSMSGGILAPGGMGAIGTTTITGDFVPTGGRIHLEVGKESNDQLIVTGNSGVTEGMLRIEIAETGYGSFSRDVTLVQAGSGNSITKTITSTEHLWNGTVNGWNTANWNEGVAPAGSEYDTFSIQNGTVNLSAADGAKANRVTVGGTDAGSFGTLNLDCSQAGVTQGIAKFVVEPHGVVTVQRSDFVGTGIGGLTGEWEIRGGSILAMEQKLYFGDAQITMTAGTIQAAEFRVGNEGTTGWMVQNGGHVTATNWLTIGECGTGKYTLDGGTVTHSGNAFVLGVHPGTRGELEMNGGTMNLSGNHGGYSMILGYLDGSDSVGVGIVNGGVLNIANGIQVGRGSTGASSFTQNDGVVTVGGNGITIKAGSHYTLAGGMLSTPTITQNGIFEFTGGTLTGGSSVTGNLTVGEDGIFLVQATGDSCRGLTVAGTVTLNGILNITGDVVAGQEYTVVTAGDFDFGSRTLEQWSGMMPTFALTQEGNTLKMSVTPADLYWNVERGTDFQWSTGSHWDVKKGDQFIQASNMPLSFDRVFVESGKVILGRLGMDSAASITVGDGLSSSSEKAILEIQTVGVETPTVEVKKGGTVRLTQRDARVNGTWEMSGGRLELATNTWFDSADITIRDGEMIGTGIRFLNADGGSVTMTGGKITSNGGWLTIAEEGSGTFLMQGGTLTHVGGGVALGVFEGKTGTLILEDGVFNTEGTLSFQEGYAANGYGMSLGFSGRSEDGKGIVQMSGGSFTATNGIFVDNASTFTLRGGEVSLGNKGLKLVDTSQFELSGNGLLHVSTISAERAEQFVFSGGTLDVGTIDFTLNQAGGNFSPGGEDALGSSRLMGMNVTGGIWTLNLTTDAIDEILIAEGGTFQADGLEGILLESLVGEELAESPLPFLTFEGEKVEGLSNFLSSLLSGTMASSYYVLETANGYALGVAQATVPEPGSWLLLVLGVGCWFGWRKRGGK